jgi:dihydrolipoamide dehydrogenase
MAKIIVLGGGPGGYCAAFTAARGGADVTLIERARLGGTCLNVGCIPTKTILRSAHAIHEVERLNDFALAIEPLEAQDEEGECVHDHEDELTLGITLDIDALRERKEGIVNELVGQVETSAARLKVAVVNGTGYLTDARTVTVTDAAGETSVYTADAIIIATGSVPFVLSSLDKPFIWTSDDAVALEKIPESIIIIGGGVIGVEFACAYAAFGSDVSIVELAPTLLPGFDKRVTRALAKSLEEQGITLYLGDSIESADFDGTTAWATLASGKELPAETIMSAVGRIPNTAGFGFEEAGLAYDRRALKVNEHFETNLPGVYAIGDAIGGVMLAHAAEAEGEAAAENALAALAGDPQTATVDNSLIPGCVYTLPEIATVGLTADAAKTAGLTAVTGIAKYAGNGKALAEGEEDGFVQLVAEATTGKLLGAQIVGAKAVELIAILRALMIEASTVDALAGAVFAHPTLSEVIKAAALVTQAKLKR